MADAHPNAASEDPSRLEGELRSECFWTLLDSAEPVPVARLASRLGLEQAAVEQTLQALDRAGRVRRTPSGEVVGSLGLTIQPSPHELLLHRSQGEPHHFFTWCALDALGIIGALGASGRVRSVSPQTGAPIELRFQGGSPVTDGAVLFLADTVPVRSVVDDWCPMVNFFEHDQAASAWARARGVAGTVVPVTAAATIRAADMWRPQIGHRRTGPGTG